MPKRKSKSIKSNCDRLVREVIRLRDEWTCQRCGKQGEGQVAHVKVRQYNITRHDLLNLLFLCSECHSWFDTNTILSGKWFEDTYPARHEHLAEIERNWEARTKTWREDDWLRVESYLKEKLKDLKDERS